MIKLEEVLKNIEPINKERMKKKEKELSSLLKIPKGLGKLEELAIQLEGIQENYEVNKRMALVMAADNGVEREGVSFSKRIITQYVVEAMIKGHSSINALAKTFGADVVAVDLGIDKSCDINNEVDLSGIINEKLMEFGTNNIVEGPAMTYEIAKRAIEIGIEKVDEFVKKGYNLFTAGEMGIGNTTTSSAILHVFTGLPLDDIVGHGSGINDETLEHKKNIIKKAISMNKINSDDPIDVLAKIGGLDIAGMTGIYIGCAKNKVPVVIDGIISAIAALIAYKLNPIVRDYMIESNVGKEPGEKYIMKEMNFDPGLFMKMNLGEGTGAILMFPMIDAALNITRIVGKYPEIL